MYAVIETGGKQYKVENGDIVFVEKLSAADDSTVDFKVVAVGGEDGLKIPSLQTPSLRRTRSPARSSRPARARRSP